MEQNNLDSFGPRYIKNYVYVVLIFTIYSTLL